MDFLIWKSDAYHEWYQYAIQHLCIGGMIFFLVVGYIVYRISQFRSEQTG